MKRRVRHQWESAGPLLFGTGTLLRLVAGRSAGRPNAVRDYSTFPDPGIHGGCKLDARIFPNRARRRDRLRRDVQCRGRCAARGNRRARRNADGLFRPRHRQSLRQGADDFRRAAVRGRSGISRRDRPAADWYALPRRARDRSRPGGHPGAYRCDDHCAGHCTGSYPARERVRGDESIGAGLYRQR